MNKYNNISRYSPKLFSFGEFFPLCREAWRGLINKGKLLLLLLICAIPAFAQSNIDDVLSQVEKNNTTLKLLRESAEAQKLENKTDIYLPNPELGFNYLFGSSGNIGNRRDLSLSQSFDFATISGLKSRVANERNNSVELQYQTDRLQILLEAKIYCLDLIYFNALSKELNIRQQHARTIAEAYEKRLKNGDASMLEFNKAKLNLATVQGDISRLEVDKNAALSQLIRLNGGNEIAFDESLYKENELPLNFDEWFAQVAEKYPALAFLKQEIEVSKSQLSLSKASNLPSISAGYMSETVVGERYRGISMGISVPLWENKNRVKQAKTAVSAAELREEDSRRQLYHQLKILYARAQGLKVIALNYRESLEAVNNTDLLKKALDAGEISLLDYIVEIGLYYDTVSQALQAENEYQKAFAELSAVE